MRHSPFSPTGAALNDEMDQTTWIFTAQLLSIRAPGTYLVKVEGDRMEEGADIFYGDLLIVERGLKQVGSSPKSATSNHCSSTSPSWDITRCCAGQPQVSRPLDHGRGYFDIWGLVAHSIRDHARN